jgi:hypothetical protein
LQAARPSRVVSDIDQADIDQQSFQPDNRPDTVVMMPHVIAQDQNPVQQYVIKQIFHGILLQ